MLELGGNFDLAQAGTQEAEEMIEKPAPEQRGFAQDPQFVFILDEAKGLDHGRGERGEKVPAEFGRQRSFPALQFGYGGPCGIESGELAGLGRELGGEPLDSGNRRGPGDDFNLCGFNFRSGLYCITAVGEHACGAARYCQSGTGSSESAEIANVGKMRNQEPRKPGTRQLAAQRGDAT